MPRVYQASLICLLSLTLVAANAKKYEIISSDISGETTLVSRTKTGSYSTVNINIDRISDSLAEDLDRGDVLEAWIVDHGTASDEGFSSSNDDDNTGSFDDATSASNFSILNSSGASVSVPNVPIINLSEASPYALSLGILKKNSQGNYTVSFKLRNSLAPYDYVMVTQESRGNKGDYDPRPGTQISKTDINLN